MRGRLQSRVVALAVVVTSAGMVVDAGAGDAVVLFSVVAFAVVAFCVVAFTVVVVAFVVVAFAVAASVVVMSVVVAAFAVVVVAVVVAGVAAVAVVVGGGAVEDTPCCGVATQGQVSPSWRSPPMYPTRASCLMVPETFLSKHLFCPANSMTQTVHPSRSRHCARQSAGVHVCAGLGDNFCSVRPK